MAKIELAGYEVLDATLSQKRYLYEFLFTREMPGQTGENAENRWQELTQYEVVVGRSSGDVEGLVIRDEDYYHKP